MTSETRMKTSSIKIGENPRTDFGDLTDLRNSIQTQGLIEPLVVTHNNVLIAGGRRLAAIKELEEKNLLPEIFFPNGEIPVHRLKVGGQQAAEMRLVENIQRKDLHPLEEATAFQQYKKDCGATDEEIAERIGKPVSFVRRRLRLLDLSTPAKDALYKGKISIAHASIIAQMSPESQKGIINHVIQERLTPQMLVDQLSFVDLNPDDLPEEVKRKIKDRAQVTFETVGEELTYRNSDAAVVAKKELAKYLDRERQILRDKNIQVFESEEKLQKAHPEAQRISEYGDFSKFHYTNIVKALPGNTEFAVVLGFRNGISRDVYCLNPKAYLAKKAEKASKGKKPSETEIEDAEKVLRVSRSERLKKRVREYKTEWLRSEAPNAVKPGSKTEAAVTLYALLTTISRGSNIPTAKDLKKIVSLDIEKIQDLTRRATMEFASKEGPDFLDALAESAGLKLEKTFVLSKEYLEMYSTDQLLSLCKELKIQDPDSTKKTAVIDHILAGAKRGVVPRAFEKA